MIEDLSPRKIRKITLNMDPLYPIQERIDASPSRFKMWRGGRRGGKTYLSFWTLFKWSQKKGSIVWMVGPSYRQVKEIAWRKLNSILPRSAYKSKNETDLSVTLVNNSTIVLKGSDNEDSLRGPADGLDGVLMEEAAFQKAWVWEEILRPQLADKRAPAMFVSTPKGKNWFWRLENQAREQGGQWAAFNSTIYDNPHISPEEIESIKKETSESTWRQEYLAEYDTAEGMVYPEFSEKDHVIPPPSREQIEKVRSSGSVFYRSFDWGLRNPSCCLWAYVDTSHGRPIVRFFREHYRPELTVPQHAQIIRAQSEGLTIRATFCDPSMRNRNTQGNSTLVDFSRFGVPMIPADNKVESGIETVKRFLREKRVTFTSDMISTLSEFKTYEWEDIAPADELNLKERPRKARDHAMDAVKYMLASLSRRVLGMESSPLRIEEGLVIPNAIPIGPKSTGLDALSGYYS